MKMSDIQADEVEKVLEMYHDTRKVYEKLYSVEEFCEQFLDRCECCGELHYWDDLDLNENWDGKVLNVCKDCRKEMVYNV